MPAYQKVRICDLVADYIESHPRSTARDIAEEFNLTTARASQELWTLRQEGRVISDPLPGCRAQAWTIAETERSGPGFTPIRIVVQSWEPNACRDSLVAALFGAGPAQVAA